jgi:hypothetical protein
MSRIGRAEGHDPDGTPSLPSRRQDPGVGTGMLHGQPAVDRPRRGTMKGRRADALRPKIIPPAHWPARTGS